MEVDPPASDAELLRAYVREGSQSAFSALVARHIDWVYSVARRQVSDLADADDVTQSVFILLATKGRTFGENPLLTVWLFRAARLIAADARKRRARRRKHERLAAQHQADDIIMRTDDDPPRWERIAPILDDAIARLGTTDRTAVLMRYFQRKSHADVARQLGVTEGAAKMRVSRALEKLRDLLARRGVTTSSAALSASLTTHALEAAPASLAAAAAHPVAVAASSATMASLVKGAMLAMAWSKTKIAAAALAVLLATGTVLIVRQQLAIPPAVSTAAASPAVPRAGSEPRWRAAFDRAHALEPGQVLRRVRPPFIDERRDWVIKNEDYMSTEEVDQRVQAGKTSLTVEWDPAAGRVTRQLSFSDGVACLGTVLHDVLGAESHRVDAPRRLLEAPVAGDWVVRKSSTLEARAAALEQVLREEAGLAVTIRRRRVPRELIVVSGTVGPTAAGTTVHLYSDQKDKDWPTGNGSGIFLDLLQTMENLTGREVVNESVTRLDQKIGWAAHTSGRVGDIPPKRAAAKLDMILANVSRQSGLQLRRETRAVDAWEVLANQPAK